MIGMKNCTAAVWFAAPRGKDSHNKNCYSQDQLMMETVYRKDEEDSKMAPSEKVFIVVDHVVVDEKLILLRFAVIIQKGD